MSITYFQLLEDIYSTANRPRKYRNSFPEEEPNLTKQKIHETRSGVDVEAKKAFQPFVKTSNKVNPAEVDKNESATDTKRRESFRHNLHRALGRGSDENNMSSLGSGHLFRGSAHPPEVDKNGYMITRRATSWSTHPGVAHSNARRNQTEDTSAHHIIVLHHKNETGHRVLSLAAPGHCDVGANKEEECVSAPARYKILKSEQVGNDEKTGKPIIKHTVEYHDSHPNWDATKHGELSPEEQEKVKNW